MRLIDADELIKALEEASKEQTDIMDTLRKQLLVGFTKQILNDTPTIDAVPTEFHDKCMQIEIEKRFGMEEVVRCKDCIHNHVSTWNHGVRDKPMCHFTDLVRSNEFYCGFGERKEDGHTER